MLCMFFFFFCEFLWGLDPQIKYNQNQNFVKLLFDVYFWDPVVDDHCSSTFSFKMFYKIVCSLVKS